MHTTELVLKTLLNSCDIAVHNIMHTGTEYWGGGGGGQGQWKLVSIGLAGTKKVK